MVEAKLDRKGLFSHDRKKKEYITILGMVDLNVMPEVTQPVTESNSKSFGFCCCKSGPLSSTVNLQRTGYAPGEAILVSAEVENLSNKTMNKTEAKLIQTIVFHSRRGTTKESKTTVAVKHQREYHVIDYTFYRPKLFLLHFETFNMIFRKLRKEKWKLVLLNTGNQCH